MGDESTPHGVIQCMDHPLAMYGTMLSARACLGGVGHFQVCFSVHEGKGLSMIVPDIIKIVSSECMDHHSTLIPLKQCMDRFGCHWMAVSSASMHGLAMWYTVKVSSALLCR